MANPQVGAPRSLKGHKEKENHDDSFSGGRGGSKVAHTLTACCRCRLVRLHTIRHNIRAQVSEVVSVTRNSVADLCYARGKLDAMPDFLGAVRVNEAMLLVNTSMLRKA